MLRIGFDIFLFSLIGNNCCFTHFKRFQRGEAIYHGGVARAVGQENAVVLQAFWVRFQVVVERDHRALHLGGEDDGRNVTKTRRWVMKALVTERRDNTHCDLSF